MKNEKQFENKKVSDFYGEPNHTLKDEDLINIALDTRKQMKFLKMELDELNKTYFKNTRDALKNAIVWNEEYTWLTSRETAKLLKISTRTLQKLRNTKKIKFTKINGSCRYKLADIKEYLMKNYTGNKH